MTHPAIEAMARAIYAEDIKVTIAAFGKCEAQPFEDARQEYVSMATAALIALAKQPVTEGMLRSGRHECEPEVHLFSGDAKRIYTAMLAQLVKEATGETELTVPVAAERSE